MVDRLSKNTAALVFALGSAVVAAIILVIVVVVVKKHYWRRVLIQRVDVERGVTKRGGTRDASQLVDKSLMQG